MRRRGSYPRQQLPSDSSSEEQWPALLSLPSQQWQDEARALPSSQTLPNLPQYRDSSQQDSHYWSTSYPMLQNQRQQMQLPSNSLQPQQVETPLSQQHNPHLQYPSVYNSPSLHRQGEEAGQFEFHEVRQNRSRRRPRRQEYIPPTQRGRTAWNQPQSSYSSSERQQTAENPQQYSQDSLEQSVPSNLSQQQRIFSHQQRGTRGQQKRMRGYQQRQYSQHPEMSHNSSRPQRGTGYQSGQPQQVQQGSLQERTQTLHYQQQQTPAKTDRTTRVSTNMYEIRFEKFATNAVHYDVKIEPNASKALYRKVFEEYRREYLKNRYPAFDGKSNAYSATELPYDDRETKIHIKDKICDKQCDKCDAQCNIYERSKTFKITLKKVRTIDLSWVKNLPSNETDQTQIGIQVIDIIIRHGPESRFINVGKSLFWDLNNGESLINRNKPDYLRSSRGGFLSAILGCKIYLNVDVVHKGFFKAQKVIDLMNQLQKNPIIDFQQDIKFLKNLRVIYEVKPNKNGSQERKKQIRRINEIGRRANDQTFKYENTDITVTNFFMEQKNYRLTHPKLPCLVVKNTIKEDNRDKTTEAYLPAELCTIVKGQSVRKLNSDQTTNMIREAGTEPHIRRRRIENAFKTIDVNKSLTMTEEFHLSVSTQMKEVNAKILAAPELQYNKVVNVIDGKWMIGEFNKAATRLKKDEWTVLNLQKYNQVNERRVKYDVQLFMTKLVENAVNLGMQIEHANFVGHLKKYEKKEIENFFLENKKLKLIIVIIPKHCLSDFTDIYSEIKQMTELDYGVLTQCIKYQTVTKHSSSIITNILLKINAKLNGINHILKESSNYLKKNCMIVGADVTHPPPDADTPSIAAVTASSDTFGFQYNVMYKLQNSREEMILGLQDIIKSQVSFYKKKTNCLPSSIIYYRDGVSDGQLSKVRDIEITAIRKACSNINQTIRNIPITCLVVQKRHHVRFFPTDKQQDQKGNVLVGTVVDTEITLPSTSNNIDFYLVSHKSLQGTARPTKYRCICNESKYTVDEIEKLTYYLCHMYARCARAVSYPAPTYYAHLAARRAKALIQRTNVTADDFNAAQTKLNCILISDYYPMYFV